MRAHLPKEILGGSSDPRVADVERRAATLMGTKRNTHRKRHEKKSDMPAVRLPNGIVVQADAKSKRGGVAKRVVADLDACRRYTPGAVPCLLVFPLHGEPIAILPARDFARIAGLEEPKAGEQLALARGA